MKIRKKIRSIAVILFTVILTLNSVSAEAEGLKYGIINGEIDENEFHDSLNDFTDSVGTQAIVPVDPGPSGRHSFTPGRVVTTNGNCVTAATRTTYCGYSGCAIHSPKVEYLATNQNNHVARRSVSEPATCSSSGKSGWWCDGCNRGSISTIPKKDHSKVKVDEPATCKKTGTKGWYCSSCGEDHTETIPKSHSYTKYVRVEPTATTEGYDGYACIYCGSINYQHIFSRTDTNNPQIPIVNPGDAGNKPPKNQENNSPNTPTEDNSTNKTGNTAGDPVDVFTGAHLIEFKVLSLGGVRDISFGLTYKSNKTIKGAFGNGFYHNYETFVEENGDTINLYHSPASYVVYKKNAETGFYTTDTQGSELDELYKNADGTVTLKRFEKLFDYDKEGRLCKVTDKTGEVVEVSYKEKEITIKDLVSGNSVRLIKNDKGLVSKVTNEGTAEATFVYDEKDNLVKYTDVDGFETTYSYNSDGKIEKSIDADGNTCFEDFYNEDGKVEKQKDALGVESFFSYKEEEDGSVETTYTDRAGNKEIYEFDKYGHLTKETDTEGNTETSKYDDRGNLIEKTDACGNTEKYEFDGKNNLIKETDALGNETKFEYDESRNVTKVTFPNGGTETFTYDDKNRLISSTDLRGLTTENEYDANGLLTKSKAGDVSTSYTYENGNIKTLTDSYGNVTEFSYDSNGHISETKTSDGAVTKTAVSAYGNVLSKEDALSNVTSATYNWVDKPLTKVDEDGNVVSYTYNELELLKESKDANGNKTEYFYDSEEHLVKTVFHDRTFTENEYDKTGKLLSTTDALGNKTSFSYDANGNVLKETDKEGNEISFTYNAKGQVLSKTDSKGNVTSFSYDSMGRKVTETNALGGVTKYSYNTAGDLVSIEDALGNVTTFTYDEYGRKVSETDPNGNTTTFKYDLNGNLVETINALGESTYYKYDSLNRLIKTSVVDEAHSVEIGYDLNGRVVSETDPNGNTTRKVYDKRGNVSKVIDALGYETSYVYDKNGNLISSTNAKGQTISYEINNKNQITKETNALNLESILSYDNNGRLKSVVNPMGGVSENIFDKKGNILELVGPNGAKTDFTYDSNNNLTSRSTVNGNSVKYTYNALNLADSMTNGRGQSFTYEYDLLGRITKSTSPEGETTYSYDRNSNVLTVTDLNGTITRTYDSLNRVSSVTDTYGNTVSYVYDSYGNLERLIYPDNTAVSYTYDSLGNIKTVTDWEGRVTTYNYDSLNREIECFNANGTKTEKGYDEVGNVVRLAEYKDHAGTTLTAETVLEYDRGNRLVKETETIKGISYEYSYDDLSRVLLRKTINTKTGAVTDEETFGYDPAGNILNSTGREAKKALSYIAEDNRLDLADGVKFSFDNDGNLISGKLFDKDTTLTYDSRNRLTGFNDDSYVYDAEDYRIKSVEHITVRKIVSGGIFKLEEPGEYSTLEEPSVSDNNLLSEDFDSALSLDDSLSDKTFEFKENDSLDSLDSFSLEESTDKETVMSEPSDVSNVEETGKEDDEGTEDKENEEIGASEESVPGEESVTSENSTVEANVTTDSQEESETETSTVSENEETLSGNETGTEDVSENEIDDNTSIFDDTDFIDRDSFGGLEDLDAYGTNGLIDLFDKYTTFTITTTYCYDRVNKNLLVSDSSAGKYSKYVYGNGLIASYETENATYKTMSGQGARAILKGETTEYRTYLYDLRGSVVKATNESGKTVAEYSYSTYGKRETISGDLYSPLGYCARDGVLTDLNGLIYMRARYYSTELMRFINQDIVVGDISNSSSLNRYTYVEGNPATLIDPFGLCAGKTNVVKKLDGAIKKVTNFVDENSYYIEAGIKNILFLRGLEESLILRNRVTTLELCGSYYLVAKMNYDKERIRVPAKDKSQYENINLPDYTIQINTWMNEKEKEFKNVIKENGFIEENIWFYNQVKTYGPMDVKQVGAWEEAIKTEMVPAFYYEGEIMTPDDIGNLAYGYVGSAYYMDEILYLGGGAVQVKRNDLNHILAVPFLPYYGDAPEDHEMIEKGIEKYRSAIDNR